MLFDKERLSHWCAAILLAWALYFLVFGIPIFHVLLHIPMSKIGSFTVCACALQLATTPWMFSTRATSRNPRGKIVQRTAAIILWFI